MSVRRQITLPEWMDEHIVARATRYDLGYGTAHRGLVSLGIICCAQKLGFDGGHSVHEKIAEAMTNPGGADSEESVNRLLADLLYEGRKAHDWILANSPMGDATEKETTEGKYNDGA